MFPITSGRRTGDAWSWFSRIRHPKETRPPRRRLARTSPSLGSSTAFSSSGTMLGIWTGVGTTSIPVTWPRERWFRSPPGTMTTHSLCGPRTARSSPSSAIAPRNPTTTSTPTSGWWTPTITTWALTSPRSPRTPAPTVHRSGARTVQASPTSLRPILHMRPMTFPSWP